MRGRDQEKYTNIYKYMLTAGANLAVHPFFYPADTALTRLQNYTGKYITYNGSLTTTATNAMNQAKQVIFASVAEKSLSGKFASLYAGFGVAAGYKVFTAPLKYSGQPIMVDGLKKMTGIALDERVGSHVADIAVNGMAGSILGAAEVIGFMPWNTVQKKLQSGTSPYKSIREMIKTEKMGLYRGAGVAVARNIPGTFAFFAASSETLRHYDLKNHKDASLSQRAQAGIIGAVAQSLVTSPVSIVKTRMQTQTKNHPESHLSGLSIFKQIVRDEGVPALWKGISLQMMISISKATIPFVLSSYLPQAWDNYWQVKQQKDAPAPPGSYRP